MSHVIGHGRYGRETYPERSSAGSANAGPVTGWASIPAQALPAAPPFTAVPGVTPITFPVWAPGDVLDGELFVNFGVDPAGQINGGFGPQVSLDGGATWKHLLSGTNGVAGGLQLADLSLQGAGISTGFAVELPGGTSPMVRPAYASSYALVIGGIQPQPALNLASFLRCRRLPAGFYVGTAPNTLAP